MKHQSIYVQQSEEEIHSLIQSLPMCLLSTDHTGESGFGVFNPVYQDGLFTFHFNRTDEQFKALEENGKAKLIFFDFLCNIPSYWVSEKDGGVATSYYRYAEFHCEVKTFSDPSQINAKVKRFLERYQPEGGYAPLSMDLDFYRRAYEMLGIAELRPFKTVTKWKLGQNRPVEKRREIIERLKERNQGNDFRAAMELSRWIALHN